MSTNFTRLIGLLLLLGIFAAAVLLLMPVTAPAPNAETVTPIPNAPGAGVSAARGAVRSPPTPNSTNRANLTNYTNPLRTIRTICEIRVSSPK